jgi:hypothetical protein
MQKLSIGKKIGYYCILLMLAGFVTGCAKNSGTAVQAPEADELAPLTTVVESYGDIELPIEMILISKESMAMRTDSFQGGIHIYSGKVQIASLKDYIVASMRNNKWKLAGEATYNNVMLAFTKPNKTCMVVIEDSKSSRGKTKASFYVTVDVAAANRLNPFGEPVNQ